MKTNNLFGKVTAFVAIALVGFVVSCKKDDEKLSGSDATNAVSESLTDSYYEDSDDLSVKVTEENSATRIATDDRIGTCAEVSFPSQGHIDINFGTTGCIDPRDNVRKGIIHISYSGTPGSVGFMATLTFDGYSINGVTLAGTRTIERIATDLPNTIVHDISLTDGKATWLDGTFATRDADFTRTVTTSGTEVTVKLDGSAEGVNRDGKSYTMSIDEPLIFKASCAVTTKIFMAVQGKKTFTNTVTKKSLTIDYGTGDCDRSVTILVGPLSFNYTVNK